MEDARRTDRAERKCDSMKKNAGYNIIQEEVYATMPGGRRFVVALGENERTGHFVTWEGVIPLAGETNYFWGHYLGERRAAYADYHARLARKYAEGVYA